MYIFINEKVKTIMETRIKIIHENSSRVSFIVINALYNIVQDSIIIYLIIDTHKIISFKL